MKKNGKGLDFENFKKAFFPEILNGGSLEGEMEEQQKMEDLLNMNDSKKSNEALTNRLKAIESQIRTKFANNWTSVRKAFLDVD
jgi:hypothetical protein